MSTDKKIMIKMAYTAYEIIMQMKTRMNESIKIISLIFALALTACKVDDKPLPPDIAENYKNGLVVLNEGLFQQNNASISFYSLQNQQVFTQAFYNENQRGLGDTANDFEKYTLDGKEYIIIAVDISSQIEILEATTLKSVAQIPLFDGSNAREPRRIVVDGYAAYVCCFDGSVVVIDLTTYQIVKTISVGANPDGMLITNNKLFVSNSGGLNFPVYDSTLSVIDLSTREVIATIPTRINCTQMIADSENEIYLLSNGNYSSVQPAILRINTITYEVVSEVNYNATSICKVNDYCYFYDNNLNAVKRFDMSSENLDTSFQLDVSSFTTFSGFHFLEDLNTLFCVDANGYVNSSVIRAYDIEGNFKYEFSAELNAKKLLYNE